MTKLELELFDDAVSVLNKLKDISDSTIELVVPTGAVFFENILNIKLVKKWSDDNGKVVEFVTQDENAQNMISQLEDPVISSETQEQLQLSQTAPNPTFENEKPKIKKPQLKLSIGMPKIKLNKLALLGVVVAIISFGGFLLFKYIATLPVANVTIVVNSQPLARSIQVKVKAAQETDAINKILKGYIVEASIEDTMDKATTGEKVIGIKAKGVATIYNKTDAEKKFKKGTILNYEVNDKTYEYTTLKDVNVPPKEEIDTDPTNAEVNTIVSYRKGEADVEVEAVIIGKKSNLDKGESLTVKGQKFADYEAEVAEDIKGGEEEEIKVVSQQDIDDLKKNILVNAEEKAIRELQSKITTKQKLISGSQKITISKEVFSAKLDETADKLTLTQTFIIKALVYSPDELNGLIDKLVLSFIPEGYNLSTKERTVTVDILGNTDITTLSDGEADTQVTLKTYVVPNISSEEVKNNIKGKSIPEAQKYIGGIVNIKTYKIDMSVQIPFFNKIPSDDSRINIQIERE